MNYSRKTFGSGRKAFGLARFAEWFPFAYLGREIPCIPFEDNKPVEGYSF